MELASYLKTSWIDYPDKIASVIYTRGCNFNCPFCHNKDLIYDKTLMVSQEEVWQHLKKRKNILEGVVISGGEPTLQKDLVAFIGKIKDLGYKVKLDTNGYSPQILKKLLDLNLLDYIAMDIKNTFENYKATAGLSLNLNHIEESIELIKNSGTDYEFRTTWMKSFHDLSKVDSIGDMIKGAKRYVFQQYQYSNKQIVDEDFKYFTKEEMAPMTQRLKEYFQVKEVLIRGKF